jgi:phosphoglycolate phosphatase-like HAD superfamily hydrolase
MGRYDGLLLDHDGVVVDVLDRDRVRRAAIEAFEAVGVRSPADDHVELVAFGPTHDELRAMGDRVGFDPAALWRHRDDNLAVALKDAALNGGKEPYPDVSVLADLDVPTGIVSNNQRRIVEFIADQYGLTDHFGTTRAREPRIESLERKKPSPTFLEQAIDDLGVADPLYVGDRESDVIAGDRTGVDTAFIRRDHNSDVTLDRQPTHEVGSLEAIPELLDTQ